MKSKQVAKEVVTISWPVMIEQSFSMLLGVVNLIVVGQYVGGQYPSSANISAVGLTTIVISFAIALIQSLGVGATSLIAQYYGANQPDKMVNILRHGLLLGCALAGILTVGLFLFSGRVLSFLGAESMTVLAGTPYFRIVSIGLLFEGIAQIIGAAIRGVSETKATMRITLIANAINFILSLILVYGFWFFPELGLTGAGIANLSSTAILALLMVYYLFYHSKIPTTASEKIEFSRSTYFRILKISLPAMGEQLLLRTGVMLYTKVVASLGTTIMAAHQIALNIYNLAITPGTALGVAATALVGQAIGSGRGSLAKQYGKKAAQFALGIGLAMGILIYLLRYPVARCYTADDHVISNIEIPLTVFLIMFPLQLPQLTEVGALRGVGDTTFPMVATGISVIGVRLILSYVLVYVFHLGLWGAWIGMCGDQIVRSLLITYRFSKKHWEQYDTNRL